MKKSKKTLIVLLFVMIIANSCGTILGGKISQCQKTKPLPGQPSREIRIGALIGDIIFLAPYITIPVDFATGGIYKPCKK